MSAYVGPGRPEDRAESDAWEAAKKPAQIAVDGLGRPGLPERAPEVPAAILAGARGISDEMVRLHAVAENEFWRASGMDDATDDATVTRIGNEAIRAGLEAVAPLIAAQAIRDVVVGVLHPMHERSKAYHHRAALHRVIEQLTRRADELDAAKEGP